MLARIALFPELSPISQAIVAVAGLVVLGLVIWMITYRGSGKGGGDGSPDNSP